MTRIRVTASRSYDVLIQPGLLDRAGEELRAVLPGARTAAVAADETVSALYGARLAASLEAAGFRTVSFSFPAGEGSKNLTTYAALLDFLGRNGLGRSDALVALGGGVTGDLAGFAAATYQRGMAFCQVPASLLAAVDSSVGGKTGIDLPTGKNQAGCFYQPSLVLCDPALLSSLPEREYRGGCAEVIKYGVLYDPKLFAHLEEKGLSFDREAVITRCVELKRDVVMEDEGEYFNTSVRGVVTEGIPMVSRLNNFNGLYADLRGTTIFLHYKDRPGIIATIGSALYSNGINIDNIAAPADHSTQEALAVLKTNKPVSDELLNKIAGEIDAITAFSLDV